MGTRFVFGLFVFLVSVAIWPGLEQPGEIPRRALVLLAGPLLVAAACRGAGRGLPSWLTVSFGLAIAVGVGHVLGADGAPAQAVARELASFAALGLVALAATLVDDETHEVDGAVEAAAGLALLVLGALGLAQAHLAFAGIPQSGAPAATFVNRNVAAQALVALIPLALPMLASRRSAAHRWIGAFAVGGGTALLLATRSRGAWLATAIGWSIPALVWLATNAATGDPRRRRSIVPAAVVAAIVALSLIAPVRTATGTLTTPGRTIELMAQPLAGSGATRLAIWRNSAAMLGDHPLTGTGAGTFASSYPGFNHAVLPTPGFGLERQPAHAHLDPLERAIEFGAPVSIVLLLIALAGALIALQHGRTARAGVDRDRSFVWAAAVLGVTLHGLVSFPLHSSASAFLFWLILGRAWSRSRGWRIPLPRPAALAVPMVLLAIGAGWIGLRDVAAQRSVALALGESGVGECDLAASHAVAAARQAPWSRRTVALASMVALRCTEDSLPLLEDAVRLNPAQPNLLLAAGAKRLEAGRLDDAAIAFRRAVEILPSLARAWIGLASAHALRGRPEEAAQACSAAVAAAPGDRSVERFCVEGGFVPGR